ncbi:hypothetical protein ABGB12_19320 [Actinocorallia sp. B10E7]|uniref:hypothetical protein n=1 Tax=Actinocorallia sp. B10E7 TaxID=3153558 RepID=UPI00325CE171
MSLPGGRKAVSAALAVVVAVAAVVAGILLTRGGPEDAADGPDTSLAVEDPSLEEADTEPLPPETAPSEKPVITPQATGLEEEKFPEVEPDQEKSDGVPQGPGSCDRNYGGLTQCVPWTFPDGITQYADKCLWLKLNGFGTALKVVGTDRQRLDQNGNKIACDG